MVRMFTGTMYLVCFVWLLKPFYRTCPQCGHRLGGHQRRADGSFRD
jgi:hypothetical protein